MYHNPLDTKNARKLPIEHDAWMLFSFPDHEVIRLHLNPGAVLEKHRNDWRLIFVVLAGEGELEVEDKLFRLSAEQSIAVKAGLDRSWRNTGKERLELLAIKSKAET